ncbi:hypothetical protein OC834_000533 [Tilletia horrida]|uniref:Uncharacterized protein n=1 Tax=Tilletia horrida TaxID=155126 RepID=A0AAN6JRK7_9BASI|nr:hypothetical protein OC842_003082 [Tilletia horrida]KAK0538207.1 hypothetical protein OC834_000533 [Tilletia horrida]KAK0566481.1 hypothetical protein OC844_000704 [Tilletia horrida]
MESVKRRTGFKAEGGEHYDPLAMLDEHGDAEPLDDEEQTKIVKQLTELNEKSNRLYRHFLLLMVSLVLIVYVTPIPAYLAGTHPENHLTMFFSPHHHEHTHEDLIYLPAAPFYIFFFFIQGTLLFAAAYETAERLGFVKIPPKPFPQQPHRFGTAPDWLAPALDDIRMQPSEAQKKDGEGRGDRASDRVGGRLVYLIFLSVLSTPLPLLTFGAGSFTNAGWWALTPAVLTVVSLVEWWMGKVTAETQGLASMKYPYRGA